MKQELCQHKFVKILKNVNTINPSKNQGLGDCVRTKKYRGNETITLSFKFGLIYFLETKKF